MGPLISIRHLSLGLDCCAALLSVNTGAGQSGQSIENILYPRESITSAIPFDPALRMGTLPNGLRSEGPTLEELQIAPTIQRRRGENSREVSQS